jgi:hypothetical protein
MPESTEKEAGRERSGHLDRDSRSLWSGSRSEAKGAMALHAAGVAWMIQGGRGGGRERL